MRWFLARKLEYYPFEISIINEGYTGGKNLVFKWHFKNVFFYFSNGFEHSFRSKKDMGDLKKLLKKNLDKEFVKRVGKEIRASADEFRDSWNETFKDRESFEKGFDRFRNAYVRMFGVFQIPALAQILVPEKDEKLLYRFGMDRDYAAKTLAEVDKDIREKISKFIGLPKELTMMMTPDEVKHFLKTGKLPKDLKERKTCIIMTLNGKTRFYWNEEADKIFYEEYKKHVKADETEIKGDVAFKGFVRGEAYVAFSEEDFKNIRPDSILICSMTRYNIVPYMKKVKGIVTDQGGVTCHAAIISRELKVPTLVGTRKATEVFKTGDKVEVDCNKGVVRKIN